MSGPNGVGLVRALIAFTCALATVLLIALAQHRQWIAPFDTGLMGAAGQLRATPAGQAITGIMSAASAVGGTTGRIAMVLIACALLLWRSRRGQALWLLAVVIGGTLLNLALKQLFAAPRPGLLPHLDLVDTYSFPSGHAAGNMIFFGALAMVLAMRPAWIAAVIVITLIGVSRVWLGVHWPSDVIAGWVEGVGWLILCRALPCAPTHAVPEASDTGTGTAPGADRRR